MGWQWVPDFPPYPLVHTRLQLSQALQIRERWRIAFNVSDAAWLQQRVDQSTEGAVAPAVVPADSAKHDIERFFAELFGFF